MSPFRRGCRIACLLLVPVVFGNCPNRVRADEPAKLDANQLYTKAVDNLGELRGVEITIRHDVDVPGKKYEAVARYIAAPDTGDQRFFLEFTTRVADARSTQQFIGDGKRIWRISFEQAVPPSEETPLERVYFVDLDEWQKAEQEFRKSDKVALKLNEKSIETAILELANEYGKHGITPSLEELKSRMKFMPMLPFDLPVPRPVQTLIGEWTPETVEKIAPKRRREGTSETLADRWAKRTDYLGFPRRCMVLLEQPDFGPLQPDAIRPYRIEWYGMKWDWFRTNTRDRGDELLSAMEYRVGRTWSAAEFNALVAISDERQKQAKPIVIANEFERKRRELEARLNRGPQ